MIYNFRFDRERRDTILKRLENDSVLCQGWGGGQEGDLDLRQDNFRERTVNRYGMDTTHIPSNLTTMRDLEDGDLLVVPHLPKRNTVSIHEVDGDYPRCYDYAENDDTSLNHRLHIRTSWGLRGNIDVNTWKLAPWKAKLPWLRYPVLPIEEYEPHFREIIEKLKENPEREFGASTLEQYLQDLETQLIKDTQSRLERILPSGTGISFEEVCKLLLTSAGYEVTDRHRYDGEGGDVDFVLSRANVSSFETDQTVLFVQVKKHKDETGKKAVQQVLKMMKQEPNADGCVITLADRFSDKARALARNNGIALVDGPTTCRLLIEELMHPSASR